MLQQEPRIWRPKGRDQLCCEGSTLVPLSVR